MLPMKHWSTCIRTVNNTKNLGKLYVAIPSSRWGHVVWHFIFNFVLAALKSNSWWVMFVWRAKYLLYWTYPEHHAVSLSLMWQPQRLVTAQLYERLICQGNMLILLTSIGWASIIKASVDIHERQVMDKPVAMDDASFPYQNEPFFD